MEASNFGAHFSPIDPSSLEKKTPTNRDATAEKVHAVVTEKGGILKILANIGAWIFIGVNKAINSIQGSSFAKAHSMKLLGTTVNLPRPELFKEGQQYEVDSQSKFGKQLMKAKGAVLGAPTTREVSLQQKNAIAAKHHLQTADIKSAKPLEGKEAKSADNVVTVKNTGQCAAASALACSTFHTHMSNGEGAEKAIQAVIKTFSGGVPFKACLTQAVYNKSIDLHNTRVERGTKSASQPYIQKAILEPLGMKPQNMLTMNPGKIQYNKDLGVQGSKVSPGDVIGALGDGEYVVTLPCSDEKTGSIYEAHAVSIFIADDKCYIFDINTGAFDVGSKENLANGLHAVAEKYHGDGINAEGLIIDKVFG